MNPTNHGTDPRESAAPLRISIAMATYNGERFLREQLGSLATQTLPPCELVATDDGSTDGTLAILEEFAQTARFPVRIYRNPARLGPAHNFLHASSLCEGDLIAFCDQDDIWMKAKLARCAAEFRDREVLLCVHDFDIMSANGRISSRRWLLTRIAGRWVIRRRSSRHLMFPGFSMVYRRRLLEPVALFGSTTLGHDYQVSVMAGLLGTVVYLPELLVLYRRHDHNTSKYSPNCGLAADRPWIDVVTSRSVERALSRSPKLLSVTSPLELREISHHIERIRKDFEMRLEIYISSSPATRMRNLIRLMAHRGYLHKFFGGLGIGVLEFFKDLIVGVLHISYYSEMSRPPADWPGKENQSEARESGNAPQHKEL